jgi:hypothetical protein
MGSTRRITKEVNLDVGYLIALSICVFTKEGFPCLTRRRIVNEALPRWRVLRGQYSCMVEPSRANVMFYKFSVILLLLDYSNSNQQAPCLFMSAYNG